MAGNILIIGQDPNLIDFSAPGAPPGMTAAKVMDGLNGSRDRLNDLGHHAVILLTRDVASVKSQVTQALAQRHYDVVVIGAGLRTLPSMSELFEQLINVVHACAPAAKIAFNTRPDDSDVAALRWL